MLVENADEPYAREITDVIFRKKKRRGRFRRRLRSEKPLKKRFLLYRRKNGRKP